MIIEDENISASSQARRWVFTINNPLSNLVEEIDIENTDLPIKEDYYSSSIIKDLEETNCFDFKFVKITIKKDEFTSQDYLVKRPFFKDIDSAMRYFESLEHFKYCIFQLEQGEEEHTPHFQGFIIFTCSKRFKNVKNVLPIAHIEKAKGSNTQCRDYCSKKDTRIEGAFELGKFAEEKERTDIKEFIELINAGTSRQELKRLYPALYLKEINKINSIYADNFEIYKRKCRDIDVTYIYGDAGVGKTSMVRRLLKFDDSFWVHEYDNSMFTNYSYEDNIVLDEYSGELKIKSLNMLMNNEPYEMRGLGCLKYASFHHVYIISNYSPLELYKDIQKHEPKIFQTFNRRLHKIIRIDKNGVEHIERETIWEDCDNDIDKELGLTKQIKQTIDYNTYGQPVVIFDRHKKNIIQPMDFELLPIDDDSIPF